MTDNVIPAETEARLRALAARHAAAQRGSISLINALGGRAEGWLTRLPAGVRGGLDTVTRAALEQALWAAETSRGTIPDQSDWVNRIVGTAMGAVGGVGGTATALAELPVTTTLLFRVIQQAAAEQGFDPASDNVRFDCLTVFASAGPLEQDDGAETAFFTARLALNGVTLQKILARVAPRLATAMGQKLAAQAVPVLGAAAGAAINFAYVAYYREMAHVHFGLRRLAIDADLPEREVQAAFRRLLLPGHLA